MTDQPRAACAGRWELFDSTQPADHQQAAAICATCPILAACMVRLEEERHEARHLGHRGGGPVGTWAGQRVGVRIRKPPPPIEHGTYRGAWTHRNRKVPICPECKVAEAQHLAEMRTARRWTSESGNDAPTWENEASPRRHANAVTPGALTDQTLEGVIG